MPWRRTTDPYRIWVSEIMLQQTVSQAVITYYKKWFALFPDIRSLAEAPLQKVLKAWQGLGYYQRARNLHRAAKAILKLHAGRVPSTYEELLRLPGFGPYTAAAVASIAFGLPYPVLDANVRRVLMRMSRVRNEPGPGNDGRLLKFLSTSFSPRRPGLFNQAMMELGALVCRPQNPRCLLCPAIDICLSYKHGEQEIIPRPKTQTAEKIGAVVAIIKRRGRYLVQKRPSSGLLAGLWEFPGGKINRGESLTAALRRECREELGTETREETPLITVRHSYTRFQVTLHAFECRLAADPVLTKGRHRWVRLKELESLPFPSGSAKIVRILEEKDGPGKGNRKPRSR